MKKTLTLLALIFTLIALTLTSCSSGDVWDSATYKEDTALGEGDTVFYLEVIVKENSVTFTINTDKEILGDALVDLDLVGGEEGDFGLYVLEVNGMVADYDTDGAYWSFTKDGEMMMTGVDGEAIEPGAHYELTYSK